MLLEIQYRLEKELIFRYTGDTIPEADWRGLFDDKEIEFFMSWYITVSRHSEFEKDFQIHIGHIKRLNS